MMKSLFKKLFLISFIINACSLDEADYDFNKLAKIKWNPEYAIPILHGSLGIENLLNNSDSLALREKEDGLLYFVYEDTLESQNLNEMIYIPDHSFSKSYSITSPIAIPSNGFCVLFDEQETINLESNEEFQEEQFHEAVLKDGRLNYSIFSEIQTDADIEISFPTMVAQGEPLKIQGSISANEGSPLSGSISLEGFTMDLSSMNPTYNRFPLVFKATAKSQTSGEMIEHAGFNMSINFSDIAYSRIKGYFGNQTVELSENLVKLGPLLEMSNAEISIADAKISFEIINDYEIPGEVNFKCLEARRGNEKLGLSTIPAAPIPINCPSDGNPTGSTTIIIDNANEIFNFRPEDLYFIALATINPGNVVADNMIEVTDRLRLKLTAEAPLYGWFRGVEIADTLEFALDESMDFEVENALARVSILNEFPIQASLQIYFADENYDVTDSLFVNSNQKNVIMPSNVDEEGNLLPDGAGVYDQEIELSSSRFSNLMNSSYLITKAKLSTVREGDGYPNVKFKSGYKLHVGVGLQTKLGLNLKP